MLAWEKYGKSAPRRGANRLFPIHDGFKSPAPAFSTAQGVSFQIGSIHADKKSSLKLSEPACNFLPSSLFCWLNRADQRRAIWVTHHDLCTFDTISSLQFSLTCRIFLVMHSTSFSGSASMRNGKMCGAWRHVVPQFSHVSTSRGLPFTQMVDCFQMWFMYCGHLAQLQASLAEKYTGGSSWHRSELSCSGSICLPIL